MFGLGLVMTFMFLFLLMAVIVIAIVAAVQFADRSAKRKRLSRVRERVRLGQCRRCGYDLAGLEAARVGEKGAVCPECGAEDD